MPVVEATFVMTGPLFGGEGDKAVEAAMIEAVRRAQAEGLTDPDEIRVRILAARDATG
jgi:hypothetical protein